MDGSNYNTHADLGEFQKQVSDMVSMYQHLPEGEQPAAFSLLQASLGPLLAVPAGFPAVQHGYSAGPQHADQLSQQHTDQHMGQLTHQHTEQHPDQLAHPHSEQHMGQHARHPGHTGEGSLPGRLDLKEEQYEKGPPVRDDQMDEEQEQKEPASDFHAELHHSDHTYDVDNFEDHADHTYHEGEAELTGSGIMSLLPESAMSAPSGQPVSAGLGGGPLVLVPNGESLSTSGDQRWNAAGGRQQEAADPAAKTRPCADRYACPLPACGRLCGHRKALVLHVKWEHEPGPVCCRACRQQFNTTAHFLYHKKTCFQGVSALVCPDCDARFTLELPYRRHLAGHALNACHKCGERLSSRKALVKHLRHEHKIRESEKWFACDKCPKRFMKKRSWMMHTKVHATKEDVQCGRCGLTVARAWLSEHLQREHADDTYTCHSCRKHFRRNQQYLQHLRLHEQYDCSACGSPFVTQQAHAAHVQQHHPAEEPPDAPPGEAAGRFRCEVCGQAFWASSQLQDHLEKHPSGSLECARCQTEFETARQLHRHLRRSLCARSPQLICHQCGAQFCTLYALRKHLARAHGEGGAPDKCPHCDYTNSSGTNLRRHIAAHKQVSRRYVCDQCAAAFHTLSTLKDHQLYVHTTERRFACAECEKPFKTISSLNRHMRVHSEVRAYSCSYCRHSYKRMSHLRRHMTAVHNVRLRTRLIKRLGSSDSGADEPAPADEPWPPPALAGAAAGEIGTGPVGVGAVETVAYLADETTMLRVYSVGDELAELALPHGVYSTDTVLLPDGSRSIVLRPAGEIGSQQGGQAELAAGAGVVEQGATGTLPPPSTIRADQRLV